VLLCPGISPKNYLMSCRLKSRHAFLTMAKTHSRRQTRVYDHEDSGALIARALNDDLEPDLAGGPYDPRALEMLVAKLNQYTAHISSRGGRDDDSYVHRKARASVNLFLRRYEAYPLVLPGTVTGRKSLLGWDLEWARKGANPFAEIRLVLSVMALASAGRLSSLKRCAHCGRWIFARFSHHRFCRNGDKCKEEFNRTNADNRKKRNDKARANYQNNKHRAVR
jgi:hypothetical protein